MVTRTFRLFLCCFFLFFCATAWAQDGSLTGSVRDASGAVVPGATVVITSGQQGFTRTVTTNATGDYLVPALPAGSYNITITAAGFQKYQVNAVVLRVAEKARADATLTIGETSSEVTVAGTDVAQVQTESSELSGVLTTKQIDQLVLNGRNFTQLVTLIPGVSNQTGQDEGQVGVGGSVAFSVNGGRTEYNNWELDGGDNMDNGSNGTLNTYPNVDAIAEVKVLTSNYGAQYGRNGSATVETVTKSGTRDFHGDLFEFVRNEDFNARNFFDSARPEYRKNDYGYTIGGPVFIPNHFNRNRDKTFFFFSEDWRKDKVPNTFNQPVPTNAERAGDFSATCAAGISCPALPGSRTADNPDGTPYPNNVVPITPQAQALLPLLPQATDATGTAFNETTIQPTNWREELVRVDQNFSDKERFFFRFIHDSWNTINQTPLWGTGSFPTAQTSFLGPGVSMVANLTSTLTPTLVNEFVFSYTTDHITLNAVGPVQRPASFVMPGIFLNGYRGLLPNVSLVNDPEYSGGFSLGTGYFPWTNSNPTFTYKDNVTKIAGSHNLTMGVYFAAAQKNEMNSNFNDAQGSLTFDASNTAVSTGNAFADMLTGQIAAFDQTNLLTKFYNRYKIVEPYVQDDWHVSKKLTLNLGLRVSLFGTYREKYKQAYNWEPNAYDPTQIGLNPDGSVSGNPFTGIVQCGATGVPRGCLNGHLFNPAPRVGFAYDPVGDGKTSIRGGYGIFFEHTNGNEGNTESLEGSPPLVQNETINNINGYENVTASGVSSQPLNVISIPRRAIWPYIQQWNFNVERQLPSNVVLTLAYAASKGTHLTDQRNLNQLLPVPAAENPYLPGQVINTATDCGSSTVNGIALTPHAAANLSVACGGSPDALRNYLGFSTITALEDQANSNYNSLQVSARRYVGRLSLSVAYTWSHSIDDSSDRYDGTFVNSYNIEANRASSNFDQRHLFNLSYVYDLPFFTKKGVVHAILGGWQWSGLMTFQTGTPFSVTNGVIGDNAGVANGVGTGSYVDVIGDPTKGVPNIQVPGSPGPMLYNPGAFAEPTGLTFGTSGRNILRNPSRTNFDMGLFKHFFLGAESRSLEFRAEAFNVFNHTQWNGVNSDLSCVGGANNSGGDASCLGTTNFLLPSGAHNPRILQLGLKLLF